MIVIVDYGVGNLQSVERMFRKAGADVRLSAAPSAIREADKVVLPGVGHFGHCAEELRKAPFFDTLQTFALEDRKPVLGICVGCQLLGHASEEAPGVAGLGWIDMACKRFPDQPNLRVPNMGWNKIAVRGETPLFKSLASDSRFYFVHSYFLECADANNILATADYGFTYTCAVNKGNIYGVQFHPEKSLRHGMAVFKAFAEM